jgi:ribosome-associated protein
VRGPGRAVPDLALVAAAVADAKQGDRTVVLEMGSLLAVTEAFVVTAGRNHRHVQAIVEEIEAGGKRQVGRAPLRVEGLGDLQWVLMDYGDVVVHVFDAETRAVYDLERLWGDAPRVDWQAAAGTVR